METLAKTTIPADLLLAKLLEELQIFSFQWTFQVVGNYGPCLRLPAQHPPTGDLVLWVEDDEITLVIEKLTHCHFNYSLALYNNRFALFQSTVNEQARIIAQEAADYVVDVLLDRILFEVEWHGDWLASVSNIPLYEGMPPQEVLPEGVHRERYLWSGPCEQVEDTSN